MERMYRWQNQEEAYQFAMQHPAVMLDMDMGTGKTRVAIDVAFDREDVQRILVVCPKAVIPVWYKNLCKFYSRTGDAEVELPLPWLIWDMTRGTIAQKAESIEKFCENKLSVPKLFVVVNYDIVWRNPLGELLRRMNFDMVILDESHRAKAAGSKVSKYLALLGKHTKYRMCLSGTPMANSPLDVYGQYRFLDPTIFGTNHARFLGEYAVMSYTTPPFVIGCKNQQDLNAKFRSIAYTCKLKDLAERIKLPAELPPNIVSVALSDKDRRTSQELNKELIAECADGQFIVLDNVLGKILRLQQITSGYCKAQANPAAPVEEVELNTVKADALKEHLQDISRDEKVVVFCVFTHDIRAVRGVCAELDRNVFELSGSANTYEDWQNSQGGVLAVQIQAGAEGVDMTCARYCVYYSLPHSLMFYEQSKARLQRPGQTERVLFSYLLCEGTIDEVIYNALASRRDLIEGVKSGTIDFGYMKSK